MATGNHFQFARDKVSLEGFDDDYLGRLSALSKDIEALTGEPLKVTSGFRSNEEQAALYAARQRGEHKYPVAPPGKSRHNKAGAIDADSRQLNAAEKAGLLEKHGFHRPVKNDPVHLERKTMATSAPAAPTVLLDPALAKTGQQVIDRNDAAAAALDSIFKEQSGIVDTAIKNLEGTKSDAALVASTQEMAKANAISHTRNLATAAGTNPDAVTFALNKLLEQSNSLFEQQRAVADRIAYANTPRNLYSNPVRWLADHFLKPYNEDKYKAISGKLQSTNSQIKFINDATQDFRRTADAIAESSNVETAAAAGKIAKSAIDQKVIEQRISQLRYNSENIQTTARLRNNGFDVAVRLRDQGLQEAQIVEMQASRAAHAEQLQMALKDKKTAEAANQSLLDRYNLGAGNLGLPTFKSPDEMQNYLKVNPEFRETLAIAYNNGWDQENGSVPTVGSTPYQTLKFAATSGAKLDPGRAQFVGKLTGIYNDVMADPTVAPLLKNKATAQDTVNTQIRKTAAMHAANITVNKERNIYKAPPLESLLADENLAQTHFMDKILKPLHAAGETEVPFKRAISLLTSDVVSGKITAQQAESELVFLGNKIKLMNNDVNRYQATAGLPDQKTVRVPVDLHDELGVFDVAFFRSGGTVQPKTTKIIDISDPVAVSQIFSRALAQRIQAPVMKDK